MNTTIKNIGGTFSQQLTIASAIGSRLRKLTQHPVIEQIRLRQLTWIPSLINTHHGFRFLWAGLLMIVLACLVGIVAINTNTGLLYMLVGLLVGGWIVSAVFSTINLMGISVSRKVGGTSQVGQKLIITYTIKNNKRLFRSYGLVLAELGRLPITLPYGYAISVGPGQQYVCVVETICHRRGHMRLRSIRVSSRFPFGLVDKCLIANEAADIVVHPSLGRIRHSPSWRTASASGSLGQYNQQTKGFEEFFGIREFQSYDNPHWIHWRTSAKLNRLMVKEMAEYNSNQITILLDTRVNDPLSLSEQCMLEEAISFAATLIDRATERSLPVGLVIHGAEMKVVNHGRGTGHRWSLMTELAGVRMGSWLSPLPAVGAFRPRSFVDAHHWVIGVGIDEHLEELGAFGRNTTVIDVNSKQFGDMFEMEFPPNLPSGRRSTA